MASFYILKTNGTTSTGSTIKFISKDGTETIINKLNGGS